MIDHTSLRPLIYITLKSKTAYYFHKRQTAELKNCIFMNKNRRYNQEKVSPLVLIRTNDGMVLAYIEKRTYHPQ